jgi:threonine dehydratase
MGEEMRQARRLTGESTLTTMERREQVDLTAIRAARERIAPHVRRTPLVASAWLSELAGADVRLKLESLQVTQAFKARGAFNAALTIRERSRERGGEAPRLVTASTGNHGRALATAARAAGLSCVVFAPAGTPATKQNAIRAAGAELRTEFRDYDEAESEALAFAAQHGAVYVSPYNDPLIVAGTGTIGLEILDDHPDADTILVPVGGGGLISGIATAIKALRPQARVIGVEAARNPVFHTIRAKGLDANIDIQPTLADALGGNIEAGSITLDIVLRLVDDIVLVDEDAIASTIGSFVEHERVVTEGAGAIAAAAIASKRVDVAGHKVVVIVTGGNIDRAKLAALIA